MEEDTPPLELCLHETPDQLTVDQESSYVSNEMKRNLEASGVAIQDVPIETQGYTVIVDQYHAPSRIAWSNLRTELDKYEATDPEYIQMAVFSVNATMGS